MTRIERFESNGVRGFVHAPDRADTGAAGLVLTHGAGSDCDAPLLREAASAFAASGMTVLRCDLPFRQKRAQGPPSPAGAAEDRDGLRRAIAAMRAMKADPVFLGGHSYGGRQASLLAADEPALAAALLLLSYPLHPPNKPAQLRTAHLPRLAVRCVFVHGTRDAFGTIPELEAALALIPAKTRLMRVEGAGHDLRRGRFDWGPAVAGLATGR